MSETTKSPPFVFNPFEAGFAENPYPQYAQLRRDAPVHQHPFGFWVLSRYPDVFAFLRSSHSVDQRAMIDPTYSSQPPVRSMLDLDPPDHTRLRKLVSKAFTPRAIRALEPEVHELVNNALDRIAEAGQVNLVDALAFPLPFTVISRMLGMPPTDETRLRELTGTLVRSLEPVNDPELIQAIELAEDELTAMATDVITWKRDNPGDDLLTALIAAEDGGDTLSDDELVSQVILLYVAGHETTVNLIAGGTLALLRNPDQAELLRNNPDLADNAVEELLRYDSPVQSSRRITTEPCALGEHEIPSSSFVMLALAAANRDEEFWGSDAEQLNIQRTNARAHLSFGGGVHHCLGAALARLEGKLAIGGLLSRFPQLRLDGEVEWNGRINLRGPANLPIAVRA